METTYLIVEVENGQGNIIYQVYNLEDAKRAINVANEKNWQGIEKKHIYIPIRINSISLSTPTPFK